MTAQEQRIEELRHRRFEADLEIRIGVLFRRHPTLCGFAIQDVTDPQADEHASDHVSELFLTEVSVYPLTDLRAPAELCNEIVASLVELIDERPESRELLRERAFARIFH